MVVWKVRTTFWGADGRSEYYFSSKAKAEEYLAKQDNGEVRKIFAPCLPFEGCTWDDIRYHRDEMPQAKKEGEESHEKNE